MDKYNHWLGKLFGWFNHEKNYAVTFGQTTYYSCSEENVVNWWRRHEDQHKTQFAQDGWIKFLSKYIWQYLCKGYYNIDYEIEARKIAQAYGGPVINVSEDPTRIVSIIIILICALIWMFL